MYNKASNKVSGEFIAEHRKRMNRENLQCLWKQEALDCIFSDIQADPDDFHRQWIKPLEASGLNFESALDLLIEGRFLPN